MRWVGYVVLFVIGALAIIVPLVAEWDSEVTKTAVAFGIGIVLAAIYALIRSLDLTVMPGAPDAHAGATVDVNNPSAVDWIVMLALIAGSFVIGMVI